ncbi:TPA: hypothetical protein NHK58_001390 [Pseudomonas aeruginosa]|nr:hypothetical protein [Pseudomonas aeruginosa]
MNFDTQQMQKEILDELDKMKQRMGIGKPEGLKDINEFPLEIQKDFCDLADGKIKGKTREIIQDYLGYLIITIETLSEVKKGTPFGWSNLFFLQNDDNLMIVGDFKSRFNTIIFKQGEDPTIGLFSFDGVIPLAPNAEYNDKKSEIFSFVFHLADKFVKTGEKVDITKLTQSIDYLLENFDIEQDTMAIEPMYKFSIKRLEVSKNKNNDEKKPKEKTNTTNQEEKAFDLILNCKNPQELTENAYLIEAIVEVMKNSTKDKTMLFMETAVFSNDKDTNVMRLIFNKKENIIFTFDIRKNEFYIQEKDNLNIWKIEDFEDNPEEYKKAGIVKILLLTIADKIPFKGLFSALMIIAESNK